MLCGIWICVLNFTNKKKEWIVLKISIANTWKFDAPYSVVFDLVLFI